MIKAGAMMKDGRHLSILGLSAENVKRLKAGKPVRVNLEDCGGTGAVALIYGATEADITRDLAKFLTLPS